MIITSFLLGFVNSLHCIGMCGPIVFSLPIKKNSTTGIFQNILYQLGRIFTYGVLGLIFGVLGKGLKLGGLQQNLSIILGSIMVLTVFFPQKKIKQYSSKLVGLFLNKIKNIWKKLFKEKSMLSFFFIGVLNGLLPCGLVYFIIIFSIESASLIKGWLVMVFFGFGTMPLMFFATWIIKVIDNSIRNKILKLIPVFVFIIGVLFILRGLNLSIPYISPSEKVLEINDSDKKKECCH